MNYTYYIYAASSELKADYLGSWCHGPFLIIDMRWLNHGGGWQQQLPGQRSGIIWF
jgi:hypothetical protein